MGASGNWARLHGGAARSGAPATDEAFLDSLRRGSPFFDARARMKRWARERFALGADDAIAITEQPTALPGFPPVETLVEFWTADGTRHHFKVFKPLGEVRADDLPPGWMKDALAVPDGYGCDCC